MPPKKKDTSTKAKLNNTDRVADPHMAEVNFKTYMLQVKDRVPPVIVEALYEIYEDACFKCKQMGEDDAQRFKVFQKMLGKVPEWEDEVIEEEAQRFAEQVPWLRDVLRQILVAQVHIMLAVRSDRYVTNTKFSFEMPSEEEIVYHFLCKCARQMKPHVKLFNHELDEDEVETNLMRAEDLVRVSLERAISSLVPIAEIVASQSSSAAAAAKKKQAKQAKQAGQAGQAKQAKQQTRQDVPKIVAEVEERVEVIDDGIKEGDSNDEGVGGGAAAAGAVSEAISEAISEAEITQLQSSAHRRAVNEAEMEETAAQLKQDREEQERNKPRTVLPGEEPYDQTAATEDVDVYLQQLQEMPKNDPRRASLKKKIRLALAT